MSNASLPNPARADETEALFRSHAAWLRAVLRRRVGPDVAEEVVQETYLRLIGREPGVAIERPRPFLFRIAANLLTDRRRREGARPVCDPMPEDWRLPSTAPSQAEAVVLKQIILGLPEPLRDVLLLIRFGGMSHRAVAEHLNISVKTVEWRLSKALALCAERLRD